MRAYLACVGRACVRAVRVRVCVRVRARVRVRVRVRACAVLIHLIRVV